MNQLVDHLVTKDEIRKIICDFLKERLNNQAIYKSEKINYQKAMERNELSVLQEIKNKLTEIEQKFEFVAWMDHAFVNRIGWLTIATHLSKGIHPSSKGSNANYKGQAKCSFDHIVSSATVDDLSYDATGSAAALDIFVLLTKKVKQDITLLELIKQNHPAVVDAFSDDPEKARLYLSNVKRLMGSSWEKPSASALNKQFYWPIKEKTYLSTHDEDYRLLIPLHPSSLCNHVFEKIQERFSEKNKEIRDKVIKNKDSSDTYFYYSDLAIVNIGGSNAQNASLLIGRQRGKNFLLPSMPPQINSMKEFKIKPSDKSIFSSVLRYRCRRSFNELFSVIEVTKNIKTERDKRKMSLDWILAVIFELIKKIQTENPPGWPRDYDLDMNQKCLLDPKRAELIGEEEFKQRYQKDWLTEVEKQFAFWINTILKKQFDKRKNEFDDTELYEWRKEFREAANFNLRKKEVIL